MADLLSEHEQLDLLEKVRARLRSEPLPGPSFHLRDLKIEADGALVLDGEVPSVAAKKLTLEHVAAAAPSVTCLVDRLHVKPAVPMTDKEIRVHVRNGLIEEQSFKALEIRELENEEWHLMRGAPEKTLGRIDFEVKEGVVVLNGRVPGLTSKRLGGDRLVGAGRARRVQRHRGRPGRGGQRRHDRRSRARHPRAGPVRQCEPNCRERPAAPR